MSDDARPSAAADDAISVVSAYGAFRLLLILIAIWSFFAGFSLLTQGFAALSFGGQDEAAERVIGAHMIVLAPIYALIAWRRSEYRYFIWVPYAGQLAIILPALWELVFGDFDGALLLVVSIIFLALLVYVWTSSHPLAFFQPDEEEDAEYDEEDEDAEPPAQSALDEASARARRYRRSD
jgi:hypothetical protein